MRAIAGAVLFPLTLAACGIAAWAMAQAGWPAPIVLAAVWPAAVVCVVGERLLPCAGKRPTRADLVTDVWHLAISQTAGGFVAALAVEGIAAGQLGVWPTAAPAIAQIALAVVGSELVQYAWHRGCHAFRPLWRFHAIHHTTPAMYWLAGARFHPLEVIVEQTASFAPLALLGAPTDVLAVTLVVTGVIGLFQHADIAIRIGPLNWLLGGPELHRRHHGLDIADQHCNFGTAVMVWDLVFGTWRAPRDPVAFGIADPPPARYLAHLVAPLHPRGGP